MILDKIVLVSILIIAHCDGNEIFELSVIHFNDFHARFEETNNAGLPCQVGTKCIGGFSRLYTQIMSLKKQAPESILLNGGDTFQGTAWYNVGKWTVCQQFMNTLPIDAQVLGNHEFDDGIKGVVPYIKALKYPVIVSNINDMLEPLIQNLYTKSTIITRNGKKIGIVGVVTADTKKISSPGKLIFLDESTSVNNEADRLVKEEGVDTVIVLSHCGYEVDKRMASRASSKISLIVGGHSHTFLYSGDIPPGPDKSQGPYPTKITSRSGRTVLVVQAMAFSKYVGNLTMRLNENGEVVSYSGNPIFLSNSVSQDPSINWMMIPWRKRIAYEERVIGKSLVTLTKEGCYYKECNLGNFVADAFAFYYSKNNTNGYWTFAPIGIINAGGLRADIDIGNITNVELLTSQPFSNNVNIGKIKGKYLKEMLEFTIKDNYTGQGLPTLFLVQLSGIRVVYDVDKPKGQQLQSILVRCQNCTVPTYEPLELEKYYTIVLPSFLSNGGDGFNMLTQVEELVTGPKDLEVFQHYFEHRDPIYTEEEERIIVHGEIIRPSTTPRVFNIIH